MDDEIERTLLVKPEVFMYKIPPRASARGYRAADWNLTAPDWTGRLRCVARGKACELRLEDKTTGELFASCPVDKYPGTAVEAVTDSSRYFVVCLQDSGRKAYIGMGFADRADSFDLNVTLQDHFKWVRKEDAFSKEAEEGPAKPALDLAFKEGQTIRINIPKKNEKEGGGATVRVARPNAGGGILPPPPGGGGGGGFKIAPPPGASSLTPMQSPTVESKPVVPTPQASSSASSNVDLLGDLLGSGGEGSGDLLSNSNHSAAAPTSSKKEDEDDLWGDFASSSSSASASGGGQTVSSGNWVQF